MNPVIDQYTLDLASNNNFYFITAIQGDGHSTRYIDISILDHQQAYLLDASEVIPVIQGMKPDNNTILNTGDIIGDNTVRFEITTQMTAVNGSGQYEVAIYSLHSNQKLTSFPFRIVVKKSSIDPNAITSSSEFDLLTKKIVETATAISNTNIATQNAIQATSDCIIATTNAEDKIAEMSTLENEISNAEAIRVNNENVRISNESTRQDNETARISNEDTRKAAESERITAENIRITSENTRTTNEADRVNAETTRDNAETVRENQESTRQANEAIRISNENIRIANEETRNSAEAIRQTTFETNESNRQSIFESDESAMTQATTNCNNLITSIQQKLENGDFNGSDGIVITIDGQYAFQIIDGYLCLIYADNATPPSYSIDEDGYLLLTIEEGI